MFPPPDSALDTTRHDAADMAARHAAMMQGPSGTNARPSAYRIIQATRRFLRRSGYGSRPRY